MKKLNTNKRFWTHTPPLTGGLSGGLPGGADRTPESAD